VSKGATALSSVLGGGLAVAWLRVHWGNERVALMFLSVTARESGREARAQRVVEKPRQLACLFIVRVHTAKLSMAALLNRTCLPPGCLACLMHTAAHSSACCLLARSPACPPARLQSCGQSREDFVCRRRQAAQGICQGFDSNGEEA
jgi:hypothetical protein